MMNLFIKKQKGLKTDSVCLKEKKGLHFKYLCPRMKRTTYHSVL